MRTLAAFLFVTLACAEAFACTCIGPSHARTMREYAEWYIDRPDVALIFEGKVIKQELQNGSVGGPTTAMSMTPSGGFRVVEFVVTRVFRGHHKDHISVLTGMGGGDCGYGFQTDHTYLVYASNGPGGNWFTSICSGTKGIEDAGPAVRFLTHEEPTAEDLLSPKEYWKQYYEKVLPKRTGSVCGVVLKPDGTPLKGAIVELWELRDDDLPARSASDPNTSTDAGHFCIEQAEPARYVLTAERADYDHDARYMAFYPGVKSRQEATELKVEPGVRLPEVKLTTSYERLYTIRIRVVTSDGTRLSYENGCAVVVNSVDRDPLSYHISHVLEEDGSYTFGYIPDGKYVITTYFEPNFDRGGQPFPEASKWKPARQEVVVRGDTEVVIHMELAKSN